MSRLLILSPDPATGLPALRPVPGWTARAVRRVERVLLRHYDVLVTLNGHVVRLGRWRFPVRVCRRQGRCPEVRLGPCRADPG